jgi:Proteasome subunit A N-terminal signature
MKHDKILKSGSSIPISRFSTSCILGNYCACFDVISLFILSFCVQYDLSASQFSPDGRVFQVEYAQKAVENSGYVAGGCGYTLISYCNPLFTFLAHIIIVHK